MNEIGFTDNQVETIKNLEHNEYVEETKFTVFSNNEIIYFTADVITNIERDNPNNQGLGTIKEKVNFSIRKIYAIDRSDFQELKTDLGLESHEELYGNQTTDEDKQKNASKVSIPNVIDYEFLDKGRYQTMGDIDLKWFANFQEIMSHVKDYLNNPSKFNIKDNKVYT